MTSTNSLDPFSRPLRKTIRFEIDDVYNLGREGKYSKPTRIGKTEWCIKAKIDASSLRSWRFKERSNLKPLPFNKEEYLQVDLINFKTPGCHIREKFQFRLLHQWKSIQSNWLEPELWCKDYVLLVSKNQLMNGGYVNNGRIVIECDVEIVNEDIRYPRVLTSRPDDDDVRLMLQEVGYIPTIKCIEMEVALNEISEDLTASHVVYIDGIPCKIGILKKPLESGEDQFSFYFLCNSEDKSRWWRVEAQVEFYISNETEPDKSIRRVTEKSIFKWNDNMMGPSGSTRRKGLVACEKHGRISIKATVDILRKYGFDGKTGRGIEKPMKKMTDAVIWIQEEKFHVSRMILSHQSSWFCDLFSGNPLETVFNFNDVNSNLFSMFLQLTFNNQIELKEDCVKELLEMLDKYRADECIKRLDHQLINLGISDDMGMLKLNDMYQLTQMKKKYIKKLQNPDELRRLFGNAEIVKLSDEFRKELSSGKIMDQEENDKKPYYEYSKSNVKSSEREKLQKLLTESEEVKKLMEDPDLQNQGNQILSILLGKPETSSQISFKEFSDPSDMVTFNFKDNRIFYSSKQILANASVYFMKRFFGPNAKYDDNTIIFDDVTSQNFNVLMNHIYHPNIAITEPNLDILLQLSQRFSVANVLSKCETYLISTENLPINKKEEYGTKYNLEYLLNACKNYKSSQPGHLSLKYWFG